MKNRSNLLFISGAIIFALLTQNVAAQGGSQNERGQKVYNFWCSPCHAPGPGHPGTQSLQIKYRDSSTPIPSVLEERDNLTPEFVKTIVRNGVMSMAPFRKTEISDSELEAIAIYLSNRK